MKRITALLLTCLLLLSLTTLGLSPVTLAADAGTHLQFQENGEFTVLHMTDWHCDYPLPAVHKQLVLESIAEAQDDAVVDFA